MPRPVDFMYSTAPAQRTVRRGTAGRVAGLGAALANRRGSAEEPAGSPWRFIRLNALSAREQIRYFYLSTVRRAGERGVPRDRSETPSEFAADLKENWPEAEVDIEALTDAFLHAHGGDLGRRSSAALDRLLEGV